MITVFDNREDEYIAWIMGNQDGFVANIDRDLNVPQYPMLHKASHKLMWSPKIGDFTTGIYTKFCSTSLAEIEEYAKKKYVRQLTYCATCFGKQNAKQQFIQADAVVPSVWWPP